jgi:hypothetical protein
MLYTSMNYGSFELEIRNRVDSVIDTNPCLLIQFRS